MDRFWPWLESVAETMIIATETNEELRECLAEALAALEGKKPD